MQLQSCGFCLKKAKNILWRKDGLISNGAGKVNIRVYKNEISSPCLALYKINLKCTKDLNSETNIRKHSNIQKTIAKNQQMGI